MTKTPAPNRPQRNEKNGDSKHTDVLPVAPVGGESGPVAAPPQAVNIPPKALNRKKGKAKAQQGQTDEDEDQDADTAEAATRLAMAARDDAQTLSDASSDALGDALGAAASRAQAAGEGARWLLAEADTTDSSSGAVLERSVVLPSTGQAGSMGALLAVGTGLLFAAAAGGGSSSSSSSGDRGSSNSASPFFTSTNTAMTSVGVATTTTVYDANAIVNRGSNDAGLTYTLGGADANLFNINATTGVVTYKTSPTAAGTANINVIATDAAGNATTQAVAITVNPAPTVAISAVSTDDRVNASEKGAGITISGTATNVEDGRTVTVSWGGTQKTATVTAGAWSVSYAAGEVPTDAASTSVTANVSNAYGVAAPQASRTVLVDSALPTFNSSGAVTALVGVATTTTVYDANATDNSGSSNDAGLTYTLGGADANLFNINASTGAVTYKTSPSTSGTANINVIATDVAGNASTLAVAVTASRTPVVATPLANQIFALGAANSYQIPSAAFIDIDAGDSLSYSATLAGGGALPAWLSFVTATRTFSGTPPAGTGTVSVTVTATDRSGLSVSSSFDISASSAPLVRSLTVSDSDASNGAQLGKAGETLTLTLGLSQAVSSTAPLTAVFTVGGVDVTARTSGAVTNSSSLVFGLQVPMGANGNVSLKSLVADSGSITGSGNVALLAPAAGAVADGAYTVDTVPPTITVSYTVAENTSTDSALKSIALVASENVTWSGLSGPDASAFTLGTGGNAGRLLLTGQANFELKSSYSVTVTGTDSAGNIAVQTLTVNLSDVNEAPVVLNAPVAQTFAVGSALNGYTLPADAFVDADAGDALTLTATLANGAALPSWLSFNPSTRSFSGNPTAAGVTSVRVTATDSAGLSVSNNFDITAVNAPSVVSLAVTDSGSAGSNANGTLLGTAGEALSFVLTLSEPVTSTAGLTAVFSVGGQDVTATAAQISTASNTLTFTGAVVPLGANGSVSLKSLVANGGGRIQNASNAQLVLPGVGALVAPNYVADTQAPTAGAGLAFTSVSSGALDANPNDALTNVATGDVVFKYTGTAPAAGEKFQYSVNGSTSWTDVPPAAVNAAAKTLTLSGLSLSASPTLQVRAIDAAGNATGLLASQAISLDNTAPAGVTAIAFRSVSKRTGDANPNDASTSLPTGNVVLSYTGTLAAGERLQYSTNGSTWLDATVDPVAKTLTAAGLDLSASPTVRVRAIDDAGNVSAVLGSQAIAYVSGMPVGTTGLALASVSSGSLDANPNDAITNQSTGSVVFSYTGANLPNGERFQYTLDNGSTWLDVPLASVNTSSKTLTLSGLNLASSPTLQLRVANTAGNATNALLTQSITFDATAPTLPSFSGLALSADTGVAGDFITRTAAQTVSATLSAAPAAGETLYGSANGGSSWVDLSGFLSGTSLSWTGVTLSGSSSLQFKVRDAAGNESLVFSRNVVLDTVASNPLSFIGLAANDTVAANQMVQGSGAEPGARVQLLSNGTVIAEDTAQPDGSFSFTLPQQNPQAYVLTLQYTDVAGNTSAASSGLSVTWSATPAPVAPPRLGGLALSADTDSGSSQTDGITNVAAARLIGTGASPGATIEVSTVNGSSYTPLTLSTATVDANGNWSLTLSGAEQLSANTSFVARQRVNGIWSPYTTQYAVQFDNAASASAPTIALSAASDSAGVSNSDGITALRTLQLSGNAEAGARVELFDNGVRVATTTANAAGVWQATVSNVSETTHNYTARQSDAAGNASASSALLPVRVDATVGAPSTPALDAASNSGSLADTTTTVARPRLTGTGEAGATVQVLDGTTLLGTTTVQPDGTWAFTPSADLDVGVHNITARQVDVAGSTSALSGNLVLTIATPAAAGSLPAPSAPVLSTASDNGLSSTDGITSATALTFTGSGALAGGKVELWQGSTKLGEANTSSVGVWSVTLGNLTEGVGQAIKARVFDAQGNTSAFSAETAITIDRTAPVAALALNPIAASEDTGRLSNDGITRNTAPVISGSGASANARVNIYNGSTWVGALQADGSGNFRGPLSLGASTAANGTAYSLTATEVDTAGNEGPRSALLRLTVDSLANAPLISTTPTLLAALTGNPTLIGLGEAGALLELLSGGNVVASGYVRSDGTWSVQFPQTTPGSYALSVRQTDLAGNTSASSAPVTATVVSGTPAALLPTQLAMPQLKAGEDTGMSATDGITSKTSPVVLITGVDSSITAANVATRLQVLNGSTPMTGNFVAAGAGTWEFTPSTALAASSTGTGHSLSVRQSTDGSNWSLASATLSLSLDNAASAPALLPVVSSARYVLLKQTGASSISLFVDEVEVISGGVNVAAGKPATAGPYTLWGGGFSVAGVTNGRYDRGTGYASSQASTDNWIQIDLGANMPIEQVRVFALSSGELSNTANVDIFASSSPLSAFTYAQLQSGSGGAIRLGGTGALPAYPSAVVLSSQSLDKATLAGTGEVGATIQITDTVGGIATVVGNALVGSDGRWTYTASGLAGGNHSFTVRQTDAAGNQSAASSALAFTVASTAPAVPAAPTLASASDTGTTGDGITRLTSVAVQGTGAGAGDTIEVAADLGNGNYQILGTATVQGDGSWVSAVSLDANASTRLVARARNAQGSSAYSTALVLSTDTVLPTAPTVSLAAASDTGLQGDNRTSQATGVQLSGTAEPGATITIRGASGTLGTATADASTGAWSATLTGPLSANAANALTVTATDRAGNTSASTAFTVTHDNTAPSGTLVLTSGTSYGLMPTLSGSGAEAGAFVDVFSGSTLLGTGTADARGAWSVQLPGLSSAGSAALTARARDAAGNQGSALNMTITLSDNRPVPANQAPALGNVAVLAADDNGSSNSDGITSLTRPRLTGTGALANATVQVWEGSVLVGSGIADANGSWTITPSAAFSTGPHALSITQQGSGQTASNPLAYTLMIADAVPAPTVNSISGDAVNGSVTIGLSEILAGTATASGTGLAGATVTVLYVGTVSSVSKTATVTGTSWTAPTLTAAEITTLGGSGSVSVTARQTLAGFSSASSNAITAMLDMGVAAPTIGTIAGDDTAGSVSISLAEVNGGTATASGTCVSGATGVTVSFVGSNGVTVSKNATISGSTWTAPTLTAADITALGGPGNVTVSARQTVAGLTSASSAALTAAIDSSFAVATPLVINSGIASDDIISGSETPTISGTAANSAAVSVTLTNRVTGASVTLANVTANASTGVWTTAALTADQRATLGGDGHALEVRATQTTASGQTSTATRSISIDTVGPVAVPTIALAATDTNSAIVSDSATVGDGLTNATTPTFSGRAEPGATVRILQGGTPVGTVTADASTGAWSWKVASALAAGNYSFTARQQDAAGNQGASSSAFAITVDTTVSAPTLTTGPVRYITLARDVIPGVQGMWIMTVNDIRVYLDGSGTPVSLASLGATVAAYPAASGTSLATNVLDGNSATAYSTAGINAFKWLSLDLGALRNVTGIELVGERTLNSDMISVFASQNDTLTGGSMTYTSEAALIAAPGVNHVGKVTGMDTTLNRLVRYTGSGNSAQPLLGGLAEAGATVEVFNNNVSLGTVQAQADGTWSFQATGITSGTHNITARQTDRAGNVSALSSAYTFTVDSSKLGQPTLAVASDSGMQGDGLTNVATPTFSGTGVSAGATIEVYDDGVKLGNATVSGSNWTFTPSASLGAGNHGITVREIVNSTVVRTSDALSLRIDTTAAAPTVNAIGANSRVAPVVTGTAEAGASVTLSAVSSDGTSTFTATANASGVWSVDTGAGASALVANKAYTLRAVQTDVAGNTSVASTAQTLNFDTLVAAPTITSPVNASTTAPSLTVTGTGEVGATVRVYEGGVLLGSTTVNTLGGWSLAVSGLASGGRSLRAEQVDLAGNLSALSAPQNITVSSTAVGAPVLAVASDSGVLGDGITNSTTPTFSGTAAANATVELWDTFNGSSVRVGTATANASGAWTLTLPTQAQGAHSYVARELGSDGLPAAGRSSAATALTIDTTAPAAAPTLVLATASDSGASNSDGITNVNLPTLTGQAEAGATVQISRGGSPVGTVTADASTGAWSWTASAALADGSHSFTARQMDAAGNLGPASAALNVSIDSTVQAPQMGTGPVRYILLKQTGASSISMYLNEVEVYAGGVNVARGKAVTAGPYSTWPGYPASATTDGRFMRDSNSGYASNVATTDNWLQVDLGGFFPVDSVRIYALDPNATDAVNSQNIDVFASSQSLSPYSHSQLSAGIAGAVRVGGTGPTPAYLTTLAAPSALSSAQGPQPLLMGVCEPDATVTLFDDGVQLGTTVARADGSWSFQATGIVTGTHTITARQTDRAGNASALSSGYTFTVDSSKLGLPGLAVASDSGLQGDGLTNVATPTFSGAGVGAGATIEVLDDGVRLGNATVTGSSWTFTPSSPLGAGSHNITVREIVGGNVARSSDALALTIDNSARAPLVDALPANAKAAPVVTGTAEAGASVSLRATSADGLTVRTYSATANGSGVWRVDTGLGSNALLPNKAYTFTASQTDVAGNTSGNSPAQVLNFDTTVQAPVVSADANPQAPSFSLSGTGEAGATLRVLENGVLLGSTTVAADGSWQLSLAGPLSAGLRSLTAEQVDLAGNLSAATAFTRTVSATQLSAPMLSAASDTGTLADGLTNQALPVLTGSNAPANATVQVWEGSTLLGSTRADASGNWRLGLVNALSEGPHSLLARALNDQGQTLGNSALVSIVVDTQVATLAAPRLDAASDTGFSSSDRITALKTLSWSGTAEAWARVDLSRDGVTIDSTVFADAQGHWRLSSSVPASTEGSFGFRVRQTDAASNVSAFSAATLVTLDGVVNVPTVNAPAALLGANPYLSGSAEALATVRVSYAGGQVSTQADALGSWRVQLPLAASTSPYLLSVQQTDLAGNTSGNAQTTLTVSAALAANPLAPPALAAPVLASGQDTGLSGVAGSNGDAVSSVFKPVLSGSGAQANATVQLWSNGVLVASTTANASGAYQLAASQYSAGLVEGLQRLSVRQVVGGVASADSPSTLWTVDSQVSASAPQLQVASQFGRNAQGQIFVNTSSPSLGGSTEPLAQVQVYANGVLWQTVSADAAGRWSVSAAALPAGSSHAITTRVSDVAGNVSGPSAPLNITVLTATPASPTASWVAGGDSGASSSDGITRVSSQWLKGTVPLVAGQDAPTVLVYDNGVLLGSVQADSTGAWTFNASGLAQGGHVLSVRSRDMAGNLSAVVTAASFTLDTTAPTALAQTPLAAGEDTGSSASDGVTRKTQPIVAGTAEAGSTVELYVDGQLSASVIADASTGAFSVQPALPLSQGVHTLSVVQIDAAGNRSAASPTRTVTIDSAIGTVTNLSLAASDLVFTNAGEAVTNQLRPTVQGYGEAGATVQLLSGSTVLGSAVVGADGQWRIALQADLAASNNLSAVQTDAAGNTSAASATFRVSYSASAVAPGITLQAASDTGVLGDGITADTRPVLQGSGATSGHTLELYEGGTRLASTVVDATGAWTLRPTSALSEGLHPLTVRNASQSGATVGSLAVQITGLAPSAPSGLALAADADTGTVGDGITALSTPVIEGAGAQAGATIRLFRGTELLGQGQADSSGRWRVATTALGEGAHSITAVQVSAGGVASPASAPLSVSIDSRAAALGAPLLAASDDTGLAGDGLTHKTTLNVSGSGAEANAWVSVFSGSTPLARVRAQADGSWSATLSGLTQGSYSLQARQTDAAGNVSAAGAALAVVVDNAAAAPSLALDSSSQSSMSQLGYTMQARPTFSGTAEAGASVSVYDGGLLLGSTVADASGRWRLASALDMSLGTHSNVYAVQTDAAGNIRPASASTAVTVLPNVVAPRTYTLPATWTIALSSGDLNGDGAVDLYLSVFGNPNKLMQGDGTGGFADTPHNMPLLAGTVFNTSALAMVDFNSDGRLDVINLPVTQNSGALASTSASYFVNRGGAMGLVNVANAADGYIRGVGNNVLVGYNYVSAAGDLNGDGRLDLAVGYADNALGSPQTSYLLSTAAGLWRQVFATETGPQSPGTNAASTRFADVNGDGRLDAITSLISSGLTRVWLANAQGGGYSLSADLGAMYNDGRSVATPSALADLNGDGVWDVLGMANRVAWGRGDGGFAIGQWSVAGAEGLPAFRHLLGAYDVNADGRLDLLYTDSASRLVVGLANADGSYSNGAAALGWDQNLGPITTTASLQAVDVNNDRSLDLIAMLSGALGTSAVVLNSTAVAENTFLRVVVANERGGLDAYGATVRLYDQASGALVAMREASSTSMAVTANAGSYGADFFGLDPAKTYDVVVVYPGSDQQVTVLTGKAGLGVAGIHPSALNQIVDSRLTGVSPGGKDVVWVAKENRSTSTNGGYWQGSGLADQMVGDRGNDVFKPNGARIGEAGDTLTGGGGKDRYVFDVKAVLNTGATITDFGANAGAEADSIDIGALLTSLGYTGARTAAAASGWVRLVDSGGHSTLQIDAHSGSGGAASGFVDLVRLNGVTGKTLADLVSGRFVHLGGLQLSNVPIDQVASETASLAGIRLAAGATLAAEGGQWAAGFGGGQLVVSLEHATASDTLGLANTDGVSYDAVSRAVRIGGTQVATVDPTLNGVGAVGQLAMVFDFSSAGASYSTEAQQATAVQTVLRAVQLSSSTPAPLAIDRGITLRLTDALGDTQEVMSGLDITPEANRVTVGGVNFVTGTESVETLVGTSADETLVGYNGVPTAANLANLGTALTFGDTLTGGGGKDTFQWLKLQVMNSDASDRITDFGLRGGTGSGQGAAEADVIDLAAMLEGFNNGSTVSDFVRAANVGGKVQIQVDYNGKANGSAFENTWFMTLDNLTVNASNQVVANNATVAATAQGLTGNLTIDTLVQQMVADSQFKLL